MPGCILCYLPDPVPTPESGPQPCQGSQQQLPPLGLIFLPSSAELACGLLSTQLPSTLGSGFIHQTCVFFFFSFEREKSIEIDLKMSNLINCQLSQQDRYFIGFCRCLISPRPFSWLQGVTNQPTNFLMGPIREGGGVTKWPTGSATGFLLFILFNLALVLMAVWLWGKLLTSLNFISPFRRKHNGWTL